MAYGQGCPQLAFCPVLSSASRCCKLGSWKSWGQLVALLLGIVLCGGHPGGLTAQEADASLTVELRVVWGGGNPRGFDGSIGVDRGSLAPLRTLALQPDAIGSITLHDQSTLQITPCSPSTFGGVDIKVRGSLDSHLEVQIGDPLSGKSVPYTVALSELLQGNWVQALDTQGNRIAIERQVHDRLRFDSQREPSIFSAGEVWRPSISGYRTGLEAGEYILKTRFTDADGEARTTLRQRVTIDPQGSFAPVALELTVPETEGVYQLEMQLQRNSLLHALVSTSAVLTRRYEIVALKPEAPQASFVGWRPLVSVDALRASRSDAFAWFPAASSFTSGGQNSLTSRDQWWTSPLEFAPLQPITHGNLGSRLLFSDTDAVQQKLALTLEPGAWVAVPLSGLDTRTPHRLEVRVPTDEPMQLAVSIQQADTAGEFASLQIDSGLVIKPQRYAADEQHALHHLVFWPNARESYALLMNTSRESIASVIDLRLDVAQSGEKSSAGRDAPTAAGRPSGASSAGTSGTTNSPAVDATTDSPRLVGIYLDKPLLAEGVTIDRVADPLTDRGLDSWQTWYASVMRIEQLMEIKKANTLCINAFADGGAIFPSQQLAPSCRYDTGTFFSDGRTPDIKDGVELLLRHFDRTGKKLIVALELNAPLPALQKRSSEGSLHQIGLGGGIPDGPQWRENYNPLHSSVQAEIEAVVRELVNRYAKHRSFAGIALQVDSRSHVVFAGDRWGYDPATLEEFANSARISLPSSERLQTLFDGPTRYSFLQWRAARVSEFLTRLGAIVGQSAQAKLYLNTLRLWDRSPSSDDYYSPHEIAHKPHDLLLATGISVEQLSLSPHVELILGVADHATTGLPLSHDRRRLAAQRQALAEVMASHDCAVISMNQPMRLAFDAPEEMGLPTGRWLYPSFSEPHRRAAGRMIDQLYHTDATLLLEGSWLPGNIQSEYAKRLSRSLQALPVADFRDFPVSQSANLRVRWAKVDNVTYLQVINRASWSEQLRIQFRTTAPQVTAEVLGGGGDSPSSHRIEGNSPWSLELEPYSLLALRIDDPTIRLTAVDSSLASETLAAVASDLRKLEEVIVRASDPTQRSLLANIDGDFERWDAEGRPLGWNISALPQVTISASNDLPRTGQRCLVIENTAGQAKAKAWVQSRGVSPPATGRMAIEAWLRAPAVGEPVHARLSVVGRTRTGERFEHARTIASAGGAGESIPIDWGRRPVTLFVGDIPTDEIDKLHVTIDLLGPGKLYVDDVQVFELYLQPEERIHLRGELLVAKQELENGNPFPGQRLLDSYWGDYLLRLHADRSNELQAARGHSVEPRRPPPNRWSDAQQSLLQQFRQSLRERWQR